MLGYGILFGLGLGLVYGATINNTVKLFPDHKGLAGGLVTASYGFCSVLLPPIAHFFIKEFGIEDAFIYIGIIFGTIIVTRGVLSQKCPKNIRELLPKFDSVQKVGVLQINMNCFQMMRTKRFWLMILLLLCGAVSDMMVVSQTFGIAAVQIGLTAVTASLAVSVLSLMNTFGRIVGGCLSDRLGNLRTLILFSFVSIAGTFLLFISGKNEIVLFFSALSLIGLAFGAFLGIFPGFTMGMFGSEHNSVNYGIIFCGFSAAGTIGPWTISSPKGFDEAYLIGMLISGAGIIVAFLLMKILKNKNLKK